MSRRPLQRLVARLRSGLIRSATPPEDQAAEFGWAYLNEGTLLGISVPPPRRNR
jgi:hypothetical protein